MNEYKKRLLGELSSGFNFTDSKPTSISYSIDDGFNPERPKISNSSLMDDFKIYSNNSPTIKTPSTFIDDFTEDTITPEEEYDINDEPELDEEEELSMPEPTVKVKYSHIDNDINTSNVDSIVAEMKALKMTFIDGKAYSKMGNRIPGLDKYEEAFTNSSKKESLEKFMYDQYKESRDKKSSIKRLLDNSIPNGPKSKVSYKEEVDRQEEDTHKYFKKYKTRFVSDNFVPKIKENALLLQKTGDEATDKLNREYQESRDRQNIVQFLREWEHAERDRIYNEEQAIIEGEECIINYRELADHYTTEALKRSSGCIDEQHPEYQELYNEEFEKQMRIILSFKRIGNG